MKTCRDINSAATVGGKKSCIETATGNFDVPVYLHKFKFIFYDNCLDSHPWDRTLKFGRIFFRKDWSLFAST